MAEADQKTAEFDGYDHRGGVSLYDFTDEEKKRFQTLAEELDINIKVIYGQGGEVPAVEQQDPENPTLWIHDYGTPVAMPSPRGMDYLYEGQGDTYVRLTHRYVLPLSQEREQMNEYAAGPGYEAGEMEYCNMWYVAALKNFTTSQKKFDKYIKKYAKRALDKSYFENILEELEKQTKQAFLEHMRRISGNQVGQQKRRIKQHEETISSLQQQQIDHVRQLEDAVDKLYYLEQVKEKKDGFFEEQIEHLNEHVDFDRVIYNKPRKSLDLYTKLLWMYSPDRKQRTPLGKMKIAFNIENRAIQIYNLTNPRGGRDHPHVERRNPCWGQVQPNITTMAASADMISLFSYIIGFLETYNPSDSWGRYAAYWFDAQKETTEKLCEDNVYRTDAEKKEWIARGKTDEVKETEQTETALTGMLDTAVAAVSESEITNQETTE